MVQAGMGLSLLDDQLRAFSVAAEVLYIYFHDFNSALQRTMPYLLPTCSFGSVDTYQPAGPRNLAAGASAYEKQSNLPHLLIARAWVVFAWKQGALKNAAESFPNAISCKHSVSLLNMLH